MAEIEGCLSLTDLENKGIISVIVVAQFIGLKAKKMRNLGGILLGIGLGILVGWGLYQLFGRAFLSLPLPVKIAIAAITIGLIILLASLGRERYRASKEEKEKFKEVEK